MHGIKEKPEKIGSASAGSPCRFKPGVRGGRRNGAMTAAGEERGGRRRGRMRYALLLAAVSTLAASAPAFAAGDASKASGPAREIEQRAQAGGSFGDGQPAQGENLVFDGDVNHLKTAKETDKLILAVGNPEDPAKTTVSYYEKDAEGKLRQIFSVPAVSGMNGISADKREGDMMTPQGVYSFTMAFGIKENPGSILPYRQIVEGDHFVDDSNSRYYNQLVNEREVAKDWVSSEVLIRQAPHYNYALVLNYNESRTPGMGSAIFLHCPKTSNNTGTAGCISVPEEYARELLRTVDQNTRIIVVPDEKALAWY